MSDKAIQVTGLKKRYDSTSALSSVTFSVEKGEMFGLIGPDGAGKTTLIRILTSLLDPDEGTCRLLGISVHEDPKSIRKIIGYMPQRFSLYPDLTVGENLRFFADLFRVPRKERLKKTEELLEFSRLEPFVKRRAGALSGGMKQKLALSCALIHTPEILVLDEPTTGVDPVSRREFWSILKSLKKSGVSILITTPYMDEAERCDRIALIHHGEILAMGTARSVIDQFSGSIFSVSGPDLLGLSRWFKRQLRSDQVRILGDRVQLNLFSSTEKNVSDLVKDAKASGQVIDAFGRENPELEDTFITLIAEREKRNDQTISS
ncbi:MAG: ABC transporter ATP-binding protein [Proteobacteria bacterium]|nr:ABC transporter ATP-binding protein [Pseudomonadota bacterium]